MALNKKIIIGTLCATAFTIQSSTIRASVRLKQIQSRSFKSICIAVVLLFCAQFASAQVWVDTLYTYTKTTVVYGTAVDFAGNPRALTMDICVPTNDVPPLCGRPVLIAIHGGGFLSGTKNEPTPQQWMKDFAKRGYVTASIEYRLGVFQPPSEIHCNVTNLFNFPWDCLNAADTSEWIRAIYRSSQDTKGAIRYLLNRPALYGADPNNIFLAGESAGGFVALATAFNDTPADKPLAAAALPNVLAPNNIYNGYCVQPYGWDTSIASMKLTRPDLGSIEGDLNPGAPAFRIRAVGNIYGAVTPAFLENNGPNMPQGIYMYHQPNDLVVPYGTQRVFSGLSDCFTGLGCAPIANRPILSGSGGIKQKIDQAAAGVAVPDYWLDGTTNNADCLLQVLNPSLTGHSIDNYVLRTLHMAEYFASFYACTVGTTTTDHNPPKLHIFPNPNRGYFNLSGMSEPIEKIALYDTWGRRVLSLQLTDQQGAVRVEMPATASSGVYFCVVTTQSGAQSAQPFQYTKP